jgi:hypothetical protein
MLHQVRAEKIGTNAYAGMSGCAARIASGEKLLESQFGARYAAYRAGMRPRLTFTY